MLEIGLIVPLNVFIVYLQILEMVNENLVNLEHVTLLIICFAMPVDEKWTLVAYTNSEFDIKDRLYQPLLAYLVKVHTVACFYTLAIFISEISNSTKPEH